MLLATHIKRTFYFYLSPLSNTDQLSGWKCYFDFMWGWYAFWMKNYLIDHFAIFCDLATLLGPYCVSLSKTSTFAWKGFLLVCSSCFFSFRLSAWWTYVFSFGQKSQFTLFSVRKNRQISYVIVSWYLYTDNFLFVLSLSLFFFWGDTLSFFSLQSELEIEPRYPLFGGWKATFVIGYGLPLQDFLFESSDGRRYLNFTFGCPLAETVVDKLTIKVGTLLWM